MHTPKTLCKWTVEKTVKAEFIIVMMVLDVFLAVWFWIMYLILVYISVPETILGKNFKYFDFSLYNLFYLFIELCELLACAGFGHDLCCYIFF